MGEGLWLGIVGFAWVRHGRRLERDVERRARLGELWLGGGYVVAWFWSVSQCSFGGGCFCVDFVFFRQFLKLYRVD